MISPDFPRQRVPDRRGRAVIIGVGLYISTWISPVFTVAAQQAGFKFPAGTTSISSLVDGSSPMTWVLVTAGRLGYAGLAVVLILALLAAWRLRVKPTKVAPVVQAP